MQQTTIRNILESKGYETWSVSPDTSVFDALCKMGEKNIGAVIVMDGELLVGIMSERDYARKIVLVGKTSRETRVDEIMSKTVFTIHPDQSVDEVMELMNIKRIRHVPVLENEKVIGMISISDVIKTVIYNQREEIKNLEDKLISRWRNE